MRLVLTLPLVLSGCGNSDAVDPRADVDNDFDFRTVLDTQRTLLSAQDSVASTQATLSADHVRLYKALGGGWRNDADAERTGSATSPASASSPP